MDINFIQTHYHLYIEAGILTIRIAAIGILLSLIIGIICSLIFLYFGLPKLGIVLSSETCGIIGLAFLGGSYMAEAFRSGIENVSQVQHESALSLGMTKSQVFWYITLPQAFETSVPVLCANIIFLIKETSVFSAVALADLMFVAKDLIGIYYKTDEALLMLVIAYLLILLPISIICTFIERRVRYAGFGDQSTISR